MPLESPNCAMRKSSPAGSIPVKCWFSMATTVQKCILRWITGKKTHSLHCFQFPLEGKIIQESCVSDITDCLAMADSGSSAAGLNHTVKLRVIKHPISASGFQNKTPSGKMDWLRRCLELFFNTKQVTSGRSWISDDDLTYTLTRCIFSTSTAVAAMTR